MFIIYCFVYDGTPLISIISCCVFYASSDSFRRPTVLMQAVLVTEFGI
jgi:hypothetical protein